MAERVSKTDKRLLAERELFDRQRAYLDVFNLESQTAILVLEDIAKFCRANESTFDTDPRIHALMEGRKEVWLRIQEHLQLTSPKLWALYTRTPF